MPDGAVPGHSGRSKTVKRMPPEHLIREALQRILANPEFQSNQRISALLSHVVTKAITGRESEIKEATIGVEVFGRPAGYDTRADSIVRTEARRLREKLNSYYLTAGREDPVAIEIRKGSYVPTFQLRRFSEEQAPHRRALAGIIATAVAVLLVVSVAQVSLQSKAHLQAPGVKRIAVLALPRANEDREQRELNAAVTADLQRDLSPLSGLRVLAHVPQDLARGGLSYAELGKKLNVDALLVGAASRSHDGLHLEASLIRASDGSLLWSNHYDGDASVRPAEIGIEHGVTRALGTTAPAAMPRPENPKAHDLYLQGRNFWETHDPLKTELAIGLFKQALREDPNYALAYAGIADAYGLMRVHGQIPSSQGIRRGEEAARKAIELDPTLADAHAALGLLKSSEWDWRAADSEYGRAIELNPNQARTYLRAGVIRFYLGDFPAAERLIRESETLDPHTVSVPAVRAELYYYWHKYDAARQLVEEIRRIDSGWPTIAPLLAEIELEQNQRELALHTILKRTTLHPATVDDKVYLAPYLYAAGKQADAARLMDEAVRRRAAQFVDAYQLAVSFARMHDQARTLDWLETACAERSPDLPSARWEPALDFVRAEPRYAAVIRKIGLADSPPVAR